MNLSSVPILPSSEFELTTFQTKPFKQEISVHPRYQALLSKIINLAEENPAIRGMAVTGSQARTDHAADALSDLDLWIIADRPEDFSKSRQWIDDIAIPLVAYSCSTSLGNHVEWRVLFPEGLDVDFSIIPAEVIKFSESEHNHELISRGIKLIVDKENYQVIFNQLEKMYGSTPFIPALPQQSAFEERINAFWYLALWTMRKLERGEPLAADQQGMQKMKIHLLKMLEWNTHVKKGYFEQTWQHGRFLNEWLEKSDYEDFKKTYACIDVTEMKNALKIMMSLFLRTSNEVAQQLSFPSQENTVKSVCAFINEL